MKKKPLEMGGYVEARWDHIDINQQGALARLNNYDDPVSTVDRFTGAIQFDGSYIRGISSFNWLLKASGQWEEGDWIDTADVFEAYANLKPNHNLTTALGKKAYKWGKEYACRPSCLTPEMLYTGFTNWELRLRFSILGGGSGTEYGEKLSESKVELRARFFLIL